MRLILIALGLILSINSCREKEPLNQYCNVSDPIEDLPWLKEKYNEYDFENDSTGNSRIFYYKLYDGRELINISFETFGVIYDCSGNGICSYGGFVGANCDSIFTSRDIKLALTLAPK